MNPMIMLISALAMVASAPTETLSTVINVEGPKGRHVQTGQPGQTVPGYFTSKDESGVKHKTTYEADEKGFRATRSHLPVSPTELSARLPITWPLHYPIAAFPNYGFRYGPQNYLPFAYPTYPQDKRLAGEDSLTQDHDGFKQGENEFPLSGDDVIALAKRAQIPLTEEEKDAVKGRTSLTAMMLPLTLLNKMNLLMMLAIQQMMINVG